MARAASTTLIAFGSADYQYQQVATGGGAGFEAPLFDASGWSTGSAPFGSASGCPLNSGVATPWSTSTDLLVRRSLEVPQNAVNVKIAITIDNDVQVWVNGTDVSGGMRIHDNCPTNPSFEFAVPASVLHPGSTNLLAVRASDRGVSSYLDVQVTADLDTTAPQITITAPADGASYTLGALVASDYSCTDEAGGSGLAACTGPVTSGSAFDTSSVGSKSFLVKAGDNGGNTSQVINHYSVVYPSGGTCLGDAGHQILQPVNADGTSVFKQGRTVPAKFRVCDANGNSIDTPGVVTEFKLVSIENGTVQTVNEDVPSTTPDSAFRWSAADQLWIYNISTTGLTAGYTYFYQVTLNDGSQIPFSFGLR